MCECREGTPGAYDARGAAEVAWALLEPWSGGGGAKKTATARCRHHPASASILGLGANDTYSRELHREGFLPALEAHLEEGRGGTPRDPLKWGCWRELKRVSVSVICFVEALFGAGSVVVLVGHGASNEKYRVSEAGA